MRQPLRHRFRLTFVLVLLAGCGDAGWHPVSPRAELRQLRAGLAGTSVARWFRCREVERPLLVEIGRAGEGEGWRLEYSWTGGYGQGDVLVTVDSEGAGVLELHEVARDDPRILMADLPVAEVERIALAVDETSFLCLEPLDRNDHRVVDLGRYTITITSGSYSKTVFVDPCHYVADADAFWSVLGALYSLEDELGPGLARGPRGYATVESPCPGGHRH